MATIRIKRSNEYMNMARDYGVYVDDKKVGTVSNGKTQDFHLEPGAHSVYAKIDWCYSPTRSFTINESETLVYNVGGFRNANRIILLFSIILVLNVTLNATMNFSYLNSFIFLGFFGMIYILTVGRKKYLTLTEEQLSSV